MQIYQSGKSRCAEARVVVASGKSLLLYELLFECKHGH